MHAWLIGCLRAYRPIMQAPRRSQDARNNKLRGAGGLTDTPDWGLTYSHNTNLKHTSQAAGPDTRTVTVHDEGPGHSHSHWNRKLASHAWRQQPSQPCKMNRVNGLPSWFPVTCLYIEGKSPFRGCT